ncbi:MAG: alpha/beta hydrolase [Micrococcaceae bacterium]
MDIRSATILPAKREAIELCTKDGLKLIGELAIPEGPIAGTLVTFHPLPTHGGYMDSHVYKKASFRLPALANIAVLRFNTRGTCSPSGCSEGEFDGGNAERYDVDAAIEFARNKGLPNIWVVGWSFGTELTLKYAMQDDIQGAILLSPPLRTVTYEHMKAWAADGRPVKVLVPEHDDFVQPPEAKRRFLPLTQANVIGVPKAKHLWIGEKQASYVLNQIVESVNPDVVSLPKTWDGNYETEQLQK